ncbi:MAG: hypothetical protein ACI8TQ_002928 [Planctomycetota bacterium]
MEQLQSEWPPGTNARIFGENLRVLAEVQSKLAERLCWAVVGGHVEGQASGQSCYVHKNSRTTIDLERQSYEMLVQGALVSAGSNARVLAFGVGLGETVERLLQEPDSRVVAWDRDPWMMRAFLGRVDVSSALRSGRLRLALAADLLEVIGDPTIEARVEHPFFGKLYHRELQWLNGVNEQRVLLCAGGLYVDSLGRALEEEGYSVWTFEVERLSEEELDYTVQKLEPRSVAVINYCDGLAEFTSKHGIQLMVWEIDPFTHRPSPPQTSTAHVRYFSYRADNVAEMRELGFEHTEYLPLAADTELRCPIGLTQSERERYRSSVSFVGSSMHSNALELSRQFLIDFNAWANEIGRSPDAEEVRSQVLEEQRNSPTNFTIPKDLEARAPGFRSWSQKRLLERDPCILLGEAAASEKRFQYLNGLREFGLNVWGDEGWQSCSELAPHFRGRASHTRDLTRIYCASTINLDVGRLYQNDIVTMRVFDILACSGFALVEHNSMLEELFELGVELECYRTLAECREKVEYYLAHPERARQIAERGLQAVSTKHNFAQRVRQMLKSFETNVPA